MTRRRFRSRLDAASIVVLSIAVLFFLMAAVTYVLSVTLFTLIEGPPPLFTLGELGTLFGIIGMIMVPIFIIIAVTVSVRERRKKTGNDIDDTPERRAAERGRSDRED